MYEVVLGRRAQKDLDRLAGAVYDRVLKSLSGLADNPRPSGYAKIRHGGGGYRVRVGDYRVIHDIDDDSQTVLILTIRHRSDVYRQP